MLLGLVSTAAGIATGIWNDTLIGHFGLLFRFGLIMDGSKYFRASFFWGYLSGERESPKLLEVPNLKWIYIGIGSMGVIILFYGGHLGAKLAGRI